MQAATVATANAAMSGGKCQPPPGGNGVPQPQDRAAVTNENRTMTNNRANTAKKIRLLTYLQWLSNTYL